ncbi:HD domain-containing phosphohydrolase [Deinococcus pimensis]|uniref:HD domain-containing phosphohydrolase n=1 Tax=Deinococcus pimensis TaxID=309888 RepID=UPI0004AFAEDA|nr:HD domain-containing phosphohydrolase [Deinococcus pimensis]
MTTPYDPGGRSASPERGRETLGFRYGPTPHIVLITLLHNVALVTLFAFASSMLYREWPARHDDVSNFVRALFAGFAGVGLMTLPIEVAPGIFADLRHVPTALVTLRYGPLWGALTALPALLWRAGQGGQGVLVAALSAAGVVLVASVLHRRVSLRDLPGWRLAWTAPLVFGLNGLGLLTLPNGDVLLARVYLPLLFANSAAFVIALSVIHARLQLLRATHAYRQQARTDALTGLANRRQFELDLVSLQPGEHLLVVDIDHFKRLNDRHGHAVGDDVLRRAARAFEEAVGSDGTVYRYGGEEFAVILRLRSPVEAHRVAQRCRTAPDVIVAGTRVTLSGGLAVRDEHEFTNHTFQRADAALYAAKNDGRDRLHVAPDPAALGDRPGALGAMRGTLALLSLDQDPRDEDWKALLRAAVLSIPHAEAGTLYVVSEGDFELCAQIGFSDELLGQRASPVSQRAWYGGTEEAWLSGRPRVLRGDEVAAASRTGSEVDHDRIGRVTYERVGRIFDIHESLGVPVVVDGQVVAFLNVDRLSPERAFDDVAERVAVDFATQAGVLLAARARRQRETRRLRELEALAHVTSALRDAYTEADVTSAFTRRTADLLDARQAVYLAYDADQDALVSSDVLGVDRSLGTVALPRGRGVAWHAVDLGDAVRVMDVREDPRVHQPAFPLARSMMAVPLHSARGLLGALVVTRDRPFGEDDAHLARTLVAQGVTALDRAAHLRALEAAREGTLLALGRAVELRDFETSGHTERVTSLAVRLARALGLDRDSLVPLREGAYLHDVGKIQVPDAVLLKPGPLDADEWTVMRSHVVEGEALARLVPGLSFGALKVVRHHHERWDGSGYPDGLRGTDIPLLARIFSVVDVYDALVSARPYKRAWSHAEAVEEIRTGAGRFFDPDVVRAFLDLPGGGRTDTPSETPSETPSSTA